MGKDTAGVRTDSHVALSSPMGRRTRNRRAGGYKQDLDKVSCLVKNRLKGGEPDRLLSESGKHRFGSQKCIFARFFQQVPTTTMFCPPECLKIIP